MKIGIGILIHETVVIDLDNTIADNFLKYYLHSILFNGEQFADSFPVLSGLINGGKNTLSFQAGNRFPRLSLVLHTGFTGSSLPKPTSYP